MESCSSQQAWSCKQRASVNDEVFGIYVLVGGSKCSVVIADWSVCVVDVSGLSLDGNVFLAVESGSCFSFLCFL